MRIGRSTSSTIKRSEPADYRAALLAIAEVCDAVATGNLELRLPALGDVPEMLSIRRAMNQMLDLMDAFVRETGGSLEAATEGRHHRAFLEHGMVGVFRDGARVTNRSREAMKASADALVATEEQRQRLADVFESAVMSLSEQVAASSTELGASATELARSAQNAADKAAGAASAIAVLEESASQMRGVVALIDQVAAQTRLLALNATIEAARAGEAGNGFAVVAGEVKDLADQTAAGTERIEVELGSTQTAVAEAGVVLDDITRTVRSMNDQVLAVATAVAGSGSVVDPDAACLSALAEGLRREIAGFLGELRNLDATDCVPT